MEIQGKTVSEAKKYMQDILKEIQEWKTDLESDKTFSQEYISILEIGVKRERGAQTASKKVPKKHIKRYFCRRKRRQIIFYMRRDTGWHLAWGRKHLPFILSKFFQP